MRNILVCGRATPERKASGRYTVGDCDWCGDGIVWTTNELTFKPTERVCLKCSLEEVDQLAGALVEIVTQEAVH